MMNKLYKNLFEMLKDMSQYRKENPGVQIVSDDVGREGRRSRDPDQNRTIGFSCSEVRWGIKYYDLNDTLDLIDPSFRPYFKTQAGRRAVAESFNRSGAREG